MNPPAKKKLLVVAMDNHSSTTARIHPIVRHPQFAFDVQAILPYSYRPTTKSDQQFLQVLRSHQHNTDIFLLHRAILRAEALNYIFHCGKPVVFDFDDAIYAVPSESYYWESHHLLGRVKQLFRWLMRGRPFYASRYAPLKQILKQVQAVSAGNPHLAQFARQFCKQVAVVPTAVDVTHFPIKQHHTTSPVVIGWYGSPANQWYLKMIEPALQEVAKRLGEKVKFQVISSQAYSDEQLSLEWIPWKQEQELEQLLSFDIGLMPLSDDEWARGKSANKALYYMGLGIPAVVSPVGVNQQAVQNNQTGLHARTGDEWVTALTRLINDPTQRQQMGLCGREWVNQQYARETAVQALNQLLQKTVSNKA